MTQGTKELDAERETRSRPPIPRFNWGAFLIPPVWGVAHGQWAGVFFVPLWVFVDNMVRGPRPFGVWTVLLGYSMAAVTLGCQVAFAANANRLAWSRVAGHMALDEFVRRQRIWAVAGAFGVVAIAAWIIAAISQAGL